MVRERERGQARKRGNGLPRRPEGKNSPANAGDSGSIPESHSSILAW